MRSEVTYNGTGFEITYQNGAKVKYERMYGDVCFLAFGTLEQQPTGDPL